MSSMYCLPKKPYPPVDGAVEIRIKSENVHTYQNK